MLKNLLLYRLAILNLAGFAFAAWAWQLGYVETIYAGDESRITLMITALFAVGLASAWVRAQKIARLLNLSKENRALVVPGGKLLEKAAHLDDIVNWLVTLGLLARSSASPSRSRVSIRPASLPRQACKRLPGS